MLEASAPAVVAVAAAPLDGRAPARARAIRAAGQRVAEAPPGYELYYLWVMAGEGRQLAPCFDPQHAWVQTADA